MKALQFRRACRYALERLEHESLPEFTYHTTAHTRDETSAYTRRIARLEGIAGRERQLLVTAAWFHDLGLLSIRQLNADAYDNGRINHERIAVQTAGQVLPGFDYTPADVHTVSRLVMATCWAHIPKDLPEAVICDADMCSIGLGVGYYWRTANALRQEMAYFGICYSDQDWFSRQYDLLHNYRFHTASGIRLFDANRQAAAASVKARLDSVRG